MGSTAHRISARAPVGAALLATLALAGCGGTPRASSPATSTTATRASSTATRTSTTATSTSSSGRPPLTSSPAGALSVTPLSGRPQGTERFTITLPPLPARGAGLLTQAQLSVVRSGDAAAAAGCVSLRTVLLSAPPGATRRRARPTTVRLGPAQMHAPWCRGGFTARVEVLQRPACRRGQLCPQFIRLLGVLGPVRFRIEGSG